MHQRVNDASALDRHECPTSFTSCRQARYRGYLQAARGLTDPALRVATAAAGLVNNLNEVALKADVQRFVASHHLDAATQQHTGEHTLKGTIESCSSRALELMNNKKHTLTHCGCRSGGPAATIARASLSGGILRACRRSCLVRNEPPSSSEVSLSELLLVLAASSPPSRIFAHLVQRQHETPPVHGH